MIQIQDSAVSTSVPTQIWKEGLPFLPHRKDGLETPGPCGIRASNAPTDPDLGDV